MGCFQSKVSKEPLMSEARAATKTRDQAAVRAEQEGEISRRSISKAMVGKQGFADISKALGKAPGDKKAGPKASVSPKSHQKLQKEIGSWHAAGVCSEGDRFVTNDNSSDLRIGKQIGKGNYGVVFKGTWRKRDVAVKQVLLPQAQSRDDFRVAVEDFKCEVEICCRLEHSCLVSFLGYTTDPHLCIIQEFVQRGSLYDLFRKGWLADSIQQQLPMMHDVACGMRYLHAWSPPLLHRDLKSLNLLVTEDYRLKVTDFGMARAKALASDPLGHVATSLMTQCGTPYWSAPEVLRGGKYNESVDVYSYAMVMLEIITGTVPWKEETFKVVKAVISGTRPKIPSSTPEAVAGLVERCWAHEPAERPSFREIVGLLSAFATEHSIDVRRTS